MFVTCNGQHRSHMMKAQFSFLNFLLDKLKGILSDGPLKVMACAYCSAAHCAVCGIQYGCPYAFYHADGPMSFTIIIDKKISIHEILSLCSRTCTWGQNSSLSKGLYMAGLFSCSAANAHVHYVEFETIFSSWYVSLLSIAWWEIWQQYRSGWIWLKDIRVVITFFGSL